MIEEITRYRVDGTDWDTIEEAKRYHAQTRLRKLEIRNPSMADTARAVTAVLDYAAASGVPVTIVSTIHYLVRSGMTLPEISAQMQAGRRLLEEMAAEEGEVTP